MHSLLVTGSNGFVGRALLARLAIMSNYKLVGTVRQPLLNPIANVNYATIRDLCLDTSLREVLQDVSVVVHTAARVHVMDDKGFDYSLAECRRINVDGTINLARQAANAGVQRFIYISSVKVNGEKTELGKPYSIADMPAPIDAYGISKMEAENALRKIASETGMEIVIVRPPLVYGPGVKANFRSLMHCISQGIPLPLGMIRNKRSLVALDNLVDLIHCCINSPFAANQTFFVSDGNDLSTTQLVKFMSLALGRKPRLIAVPASIITAVAVVCGKSNVASRLCESLQVDISNTRSLLGWTPPVSVDESLRSTAEHFLNEQ
ncbi:UDP-glucose 4-epimerase family protein [Chitinimonas sp. PSY-7]|uniref:NAD-dependent epimerase/dehydratase family protein n=1 Tax=Chitinimonas sp. PSY-7 TaxID=3459088 RepID=UPI00403FCA62